MGISNSLKTTFDENPELYHSIRPRYPAALLDTLVNMAQLKDNSKLLEIGPGTGQATEFLAKHNFSIQGIELGQKLARFAQRELRKYKNVEIINGAFEEIELLPENYDLVFSATAFHWINPEVKYAKPYKILKSRGNLAIIETHHLSDSCGDLFFFASQPIYKKYCGKDCYDTGFHLKEITELSACNVDERFFKVVSFDVFPLVVNYSANEYLKLLNTYSDVLSLDIEKRKVFLNDIRNLIENDYNGQIAKYYGMSLTIANKIN